MQVRKQQLELDMEQHTVSKFRKEYIKSVYCLPADLTYIQSSQQADKVVWYSSLFKIFPQFVVVVLWHSQ